MDPVTLEARQLSRILHNAQGNKALLADASFQLERGQVMAVLGPSGAGKTTLLRLLNRLDEPTGGSVLLDGRDTREFDPMELRRRIGMVMQRPYLFPGTIAQNVRYGPAQHGIAFSFDQIEERLRQVGMTGTATHDVSTLSGGEAQRISIARALANEPEILLLDEPTSALDPEAKQAIEQLLQRLVRERHTTCVWVTHDLDQARRVADCILRIEAGKMVALTATQEFFHA
jgi:putative ABC transport system ATP-binding protein